MRLGYYVPEFPSQTHAFFWREVEALREMGAEVHLLSSRRPGPGASSHEFAEGAARETHYLFPPRWATALAALACRPVGTCRCLAYLAGLRETPLRRRLLKAGLMLAAADLLVYSRRLRLEHIHAHSCADTAHVVALCALLDGPPYSLTLHGDLPVYGGDHGHKMARAAFVACVTTALRKQVSTALGIDPVRLPVLWMGVDTERFRDDGSRLPQRGRLHVVTIARLNAMKGHRHALAAVCTALSAGCDVRYTIAGEGPFRQTIEEEIRRLGLQDRVELTGTIAEGAVVGLLQQADAFVLPSVGLGEAAPVSVMEAMACGLPVIVSIIGGTPDMIADGVDGLLVEQGDERALAEALIRLAGDPEERTRLGMRARRRAVRDFDSRQTARGLLEAIRRSLGGTEGTAHEMAAVADGRCTELRPR
jgi:glycosyltransferase involved in cell wall biosynthesis